jgi:hypothetical protein
MIDCTVGFESSRMIGCRTCTISATLQIVEISEASDYVESILPTE